ncbi:hypothetical protein SELMODRAFT_403151 [Selaginella moellendorffii]|uniref:Uncharacterized protein n=1 Tax=Selaginella moellendorffii TaxID=88036 RepID=D8QP76_SELML|nr:hypothetical protein SELMODRAFT_403151 [Selaginella moellendorffii]
MHASNFSKSATDDCIAIGIVKRIALALGPNFHRRRSSIYLGNVESRREEKGFTIVTSFIFGCPCPQHPLYEPSPPMEEFARFPGETTPYALSSGCHTIMLITRWRIVVIGSVHGRKIPLVLAFVMYICTKMKHKYEVRHRVAGLGLVYNELVHMSLYPYLTYTYVAALGALISRGTVATGTYLMQKNTGRFWNEQRTPPPPTTRPLLLRRRFEEDLMVADNDELGAGSSVSEDDSLGSIERRGSPTCSATATCELGTRSSSRKCKHSVRPCTPA